jgi:hypothetical protein
MTKSWAGRIKRMRGQPIKSIRIASRRKLILTDSLLKEAGKLKKRGEIFAIVPKKFKDEANNYKRQYNEKCPYKEDIDVKNLAVKLYIDSIYSTDLDRLGWKETKEAKKLIAAGIKPLDALALAVARERRKLQ